MTMRKYGGSQYPLVANQLLLGDNSEGWGLEVGANEGLVQLPPGARVRSAQLAIDVVFDTGATIEIQSTNGSVTLPAAPADTLGVTNVNIDQTLLTAGDEITVVTAGTAMTTGEGRLIVEYIVNDRQNENQ